MKKHILTILIPVLALGALCQTSCNKDKPDNKEYEPVKIHSDWFDVEYLGDRIYLIGEPKSSQGNTSYLILGDTRAIMFDTGCGENNEVQGTKIKYIIDQITTLPVTLLQSHFHFDHNQNIHEFDRIAFPDLPVLRERVGDDGVFQFTLQDLFEGDYPSEVVVDEWISIETDIDLGGRVIQLVHTPGHSDESVAIIVASSKMILLGDYLYNGTLFLFHNDDVTLYRQTADHLNSMISPGYSLFGAHGDPEIAFAQLQKLYDFLSCIEGGVCQFMVQTVWGIPARIYNYEDMQLLVFQQD